MPENALDGLPEDGDHADDLGFPQHRHQQQRPRPAELDQFHDRREAGEIGMLLFDVDDMDELPGRNQLPQRVDRRRVDDRIAQKGFRESRRQVEHRGAAEAAAFIENQEAELGIADPAGTRQDGAEHRIEFAGRAADDLQHLGRRGLMLQRFAQIGGLRLHLVEQAGVLDRDHRLVGEGLHQIDLARGERAGFRPCQHHHAFDRVVPQHAARRACRESC